jgi:hypothetical protein
MPKYHVPRFHMIAAARIAKIIAKAMEVVAAIGTR